MNSEQQKSENRSLVGRLLILTVAMFGFGFALVAVPVFSLIMAPPEAVVLSVLPTLTISLFGIRSYWGVVPLKPMWPLVLMAFVGTVAGTWVVTVISASGFRLWAGLSVILACLGMTVGNLLALRQTYGARLQDVQIAALGQG